MERERDRFARWLLFSLCVHSLRPGRQLTLLPNCHAKVVCIGLAACGSFCWTLTLLWVLPARPSYPVIKSGSWTSRTPRCSHSFHYSYINKKHPLLPAKLHSLLLSIVYSVKKGLLLCKWNYLAYVYRLALIVISLSLPKQRHKTDRREHNWTRRESNTACRFQTRWEMSSEIIIWFTRPAIFWR